MHDSYVTAFNTQRTTAKWVDMLTKNLTNIYTPGYKEAQGNFKTFLDGTMLEDTIVKASQGKAVPGTSPENVFLEGKGFFVTRDNDGDIVYTRHGEFKFDGEGIYKTADGKEVQGYILDDNGKIMGASAPQNSDSHTRSGIEGGPSATATSSIKLWIDPNNGKYLGKYDEYEIKTDGVIYGKADKGKIKVPLYKIAIMNFHDPQSLTQIKDGQFIENDISGKPVVGKGEIRSGLIELSNTDLNGNIMYMKQAKMQMELTNKLISTNKQLLEEAVRLLQ